MSNIQQLYCTHCTYGSSALEQNAGELADRTLGYSARAGSLEGDSLRQSYRQTERYAYYYLPRDTPSDAKLGLAAATAPQRLVCVPSLGGQQMLAQVCYRPTDCEGRPGSYFAHVLLRDQADGQEPWSPLHCARLWGAPGWVREDSPAIPYRLPPLAKLDDLLGGGQPLVDDRVLLSFLSTPAGGAFSDPGGVIPRRWQRIDAVLRRHAFAEAFDALIEVGTQQQPSLLLVIEPSLAALFFFGMLRLLPAGPLRDTLSFSTFEPNPDRLCTTLAATWFFEPERASVPADGFGVRGIVVNTLENRPAPPPRRQSAYAHAAIDRLLNAGWYSVDCTLEDLQAVQAHSIDDLERLTAVESLAQTLLAGRDLPLGLDLRRSPQVAAYLRRCIARELFSRRDITPTLNKLVGKPAHLIVLELLAGEADDSGARPAVEYLLQRLPDEQFGVLFRLDSVPAQFKLDVLARRVTFHGKVPPGCEWLWDAAALCATAVGATGVPSVHAPGATGVPPVFQTGATGVSPVFEKHGRDGRGTQPSGALLPFLLARLDPDTVERFCRNTAEQYRAVFFVALLQARRLPGSGSKALTPVAELLPAVAVADVYRIAGDGFFGQYPADEPTLGRKLHELLAALPDDGDAFSARLDALLAGKDHLPSDRDCRTVECWDICRRAIMELGALQCREGYAFAPPVQEPMEAACRKLSAAVAEALPDDAVNDEDEIVGADRLGCLHAFGRALLGEELLPAGIDEHDALWGAMAYFFENGQWPAASAARTAAHPPPPPPSGSLEFAPAPLSHKPAAKKSDSRTAKKSESRTMLYVAAAGVTAVVFVVGALIYASSRGDGKRGKPEDEQKTVASTKSKTAVETPAKTKTKLPEKTVPVEKTPAKTIEIPPEKTPEKPTEQPKPKPDDEQKWKNLASKLAEQKKGAVLPLTFKDGVATLSPEDLGQLKQPSALFLGAGRLQLGEQVIEFGQDFSNEKPTSRQQIPEEVAEKLFEYASVWVEIKKDENGFRLIVAPKKFSDDGTELLMLEPDELAAKDRAKAQIAAQCKSIMAVVYPPPAAPIKPKPEPKPEVVVDRVPQMNGRFTEKSPKPFTPGEGSMAALRCQILPASGGEMPGWFTRLYTVKCHGTLYMSNGTRQEFELTVFNKKSIKIKTVSEPQGLPDGVKKIELRLVVYRVDSEGIEGRGRTKEEAIARSETHKLDDIQNAKEYLVQFLVLKKDLDNMNPATKPKSEKTPPKAGPSPEPESPDAS